MGEILIGRLGEVALKAETTKGTKNLPAVDGSESKLRVYNLAWNPDIQIDERATMAKTLSRYPHLVGQKLGQLTFGVELRKTAVTDTEDFWGTLLKMAGCAFNSGTGVYSPTTDQSAHVTGTVLAWIGSNGASAGAVRVGLRGAMCNVEMDCMVGKKVMCNVTISGVHDEPSGTDLAPTDDGLNTITHEAAVPAVFNGVAFTYAGNTRRISTFKFNFGNTVAPREDVSSSGGVLHYVITDRVPTGSIDPDLGLVAEDDYLTDMNAGTEVALAWSLSQPAAAGVNARTIAMAIPKAQLTKVTPGERNGIRVMGCDFAANRNAEPGDDEWTLTITGS